MFSRTGLLIIAVGVVPLIAAGVLVVGGIWQVPQGPAGTAATIFFGST